MATFVAARYGPGRNLSRRRFTRFRCRSARLLDAMRPVSFLSPPSPERFFRAHDERIILSRIVAIFVPCKSSDLPAFKPPLLGRIVTGANDQYSVRVD